MRITPFYLIYFTSKNCKLEKDIQVVRFETFSNLVFASEPQGIFCLICVKCLNRPLTISSVADFQPLETCQQFKLLFQPLVLQAPANTWDCFVGFCYY